MSSFKEALTPEAEQTLWRRIYATRPLIALAIIAGWVSIYFAYQDSWLGAVIALVSSLLGIVTLSRGHDLFRQQRQQYRQAYDTAMARNRALDRLRGLAATLLAGSDLQVLFLEVAQAAADLLDAEAGQVTLVVEEGRFLRIAAATGSLEQMSGTLIPVDTSFSGWVVTEAAPLTVDDLAADGRFIAPPPLDRGNAIIAPLVSVDVVIGTVGAFNRRDGRPFDADDLQLLKTLGDQAVVGIDRAQAINEIRQSEQALAQKNDELRRATQLKNEFLTNMSHELRTPLNSIIGFSDLMLAGGSGEVSPDQQEYLEAVLRNGKHLLGLINSVLDLSKIEAGHMELELVSTDMRQAIHRVVADSSSLRSAKEQECVVVMDENDDLMIIADDIRVRQILFNLLSNASKFTPEKGTITVSAVRTRAPFPLPSDRTGDQVRLLTRDAVWISVIDTGIGIPTDHMPKLFQEFSQVDASASRRAQGTGLGLALSRRFVELHGGTIGVESIQGVGSTFWFILPVDGPIRRHQPA